MEFPEELQYTEEHQWVLVEGDLATIGITDYAQEQLGEVVFLELPEEGSEIGADKPLGVVESVKAVSDIYAPVSGEVVEVNGPLIDEPEIINTSPYEDAWMLKVQIANPEQLNKLMSAEEYREYLEGLD